MARRAAGQLAGVRDLVFLDEPLTDPGIVGGALVRHVEDLVARADVFRRVAVAIQAPPHHQRVLLVHQRHAVDAPVARGAADALGDVDAVVEVDEVRQVVHAGPFERPVLAEAGAHRLEDRRVGPDLRGAGYSRLWSRGVCDTRALR